ncbi:MAG: hypothetical protein JWO08_2325 [Verrucomicrobiaceae bacterium]|nr:hypothetical protein [Verrucomicrobiaceae bacterium]
MIHLSPYHRLLTGAVMSLLLSSALHLQGQAVDPAQVVSAVVLNGYMREDWPAQGVVGFRRPGHTGDVTVNFALSGTAKINLDYTVSATATLTIPDGETETWLRFTPQTDAITEPVESLVVTLETGTGYTLTKVAAQKAVSLTLANASTKPGPHASARFLLQAAFGPDSDSTADADIIPQNVQQVMAQGFEGWINDQVMRPIGYQKPYIDWAIRNKKPETKVTSWWNRAMGVPALYPGGKAQAPDPLRQRMAFALSEIFVISDQVDGLVNEDSGMAGYYDMLLTRSFGNFRDLLYDVAMHPCMGVYLSHLGNRKADPKAGTFPDENFAREVMQLFSIGLWELNYDGTRKLDIEGEPIPTYNIATITEFARVFTGLDFAPSIVRDTQNFVSPMRMYDELHDCNAKTLLNHVTLPARTESEPDKGTAGLQDVRDTIDCLFNHPSCPPFICKQLIQRFITSNPSPAYVERVTAKFINNGAGVRGDLKAVLKAILLDPEARSPAMLADSTFGKVREPYLRTVNLVRAFNSKAVTGTYIINYLSYNFLQQPYSAPSVFNFFKPGYSPPGALSDAGLVAPELQIANALTVLASANYYYYSISDGFNQDSVPTESGVVRPQLGGERALADNVPALMRRLDLVLTGGTLSAQQHQIIREAVEAITRDNSDSYKDDRVQMAIYLISAAPEFSMIR